MLNLSRNFGRLLPAVGRVGMRGEHTLPALPYDVKALEPVISGDIMALHHGKHHQAYVNNLNIAEAKLQKAIADDDVVAQVALQPALRFNGGGHINHSIFWENLSPQGGGEPTGDLKEAVCRSFGSVDGLREEMSAAAVGVQGSGWAWLGWSANGLKVYTCANQDPCLAETGAVPVLGIDVWEHAYYLQYKNARPEYVKAIWQVVNWDDVSDRYHKAVMEHLGE